MDVWETVVDGSTLPVGDFWQHLNAQAGGSWGEVEILVEAIRTAEIITVISTSCTAEDLTAEIITVASVTVDSEIHTADCAGHLEVDI